VIAPLSVPERRSPITVVPVHRPPQTRRRAIRSRRARWIIPALALFCGLFGSAALAGPPRIEGFEAVEIRAFDSKALPEYINGQAGQYIRYGFRSLRSHRYENRDRSAGVVLDIYEFETPLGAYGVYLGYGAGLADRLGLGLPSSGDPYAVALLKGRHLVQASTATPSPYIEKTLPILASRAADTLPDTPPPGELAWLPEENREPDSLRYVADGVLRTPELPVGLSARYRTGDRPLDLGLAWFQTPEQAEKAMAGAAGRLNRAVRSDKAPPPDLPKGFIAVSHPYRGLIVMAHRDRFVALVMGSERPGPAVELIRALWARLP